MGSERQPASGRAEPQEDPTPPSQLAGPWRGRKAAARRRGAKPAVPAARDARPGPGPHRPRPMVLPTCPMAEFALPRHSAVMERLRRRIELCRRHHSTCEARYEAVSPERLELERQHTFALHQRCIQAKAKRAGKHRQPPAPPPAPAPRLDAADGPEHGRPVAVSRAPGAAPSAEMLLRPRSGQGTWQGTERLSPAAKGTVALVWENRTVKTLVRLRLGRLVNS